MVLRFLKLEKLLAYRVIYLKKTKELAQLKLAFQTLIIIALKLIYQKDIESRA